MGVILPVEILQTILALYPCRENQIESLAKLYNGTFPPPRVLVAHGLEETHKLEVVSAVLQARSLRHMIIRSRDCLTQRHLLTKIFAGCCTLLESEGGDESFDRIDSISSLVVMLERLFRKRDEQFILVLDSVDVQKGGGSTLLPALARLGDMVSNVSIIITSSSPHPLQLHKSGVPYIHFNPYSRAEAVHLITKEDPAMPEDMKDIKIEDLRKIYLQFAVTVYDSLVAATSSTSINTFRNLCEKLWPRFIWPAISDEVLSGKSETATWDFGRLLVRNRALFQAEGEQLVIDRLQPSSEPCTFAELREVCKRTASKGSSISTSSAKAPNTPTKGANATSNTETSSLPPLLKHFSTILLLSTYLASHTPQKNDIILFSRLSSSTKRIRKSRTPRKSIFKSPSKTPTKAGSNMDGGNAAGVWASAAAGGMSKNMLGRTRTLFDLKFGAPKAFSLERVVGILRAVHPDGFRHTRSVADRVCREMGELERLKLVERVSADDEMEGGGRWKIAVGREFVEGMLVGWGIKGGIAEWELQGEE